MGNQFIVNLSDNDLFSQLSKNDLLVLKKQIIDSKLEYRRNVWFKKDATIGLEIEYEYVEKELVDNYVLENCCEWNSASEVTIHCGGEIKSPILTGAPVDWDKLQKICLFLEKNEAVMNENAGGHIHIGSHILKGNIDYWRQFLKMYMIYEKDLLRFLFGEMEVARESFQHYASPIANLLYRGLANLNGCSCFEEIYDQVLPKDKNEAVNFCNVSEVDAIKRLKNTIEFRSPNASSKAIIWQNNVNTLVKFLLSFEREEIDEEYLDYRLLKEPDEFPCFSDALQFIDMIFENNEDKIYFLKQYMKSFHFDKRLSRGLVKTLF